MHFVEAGIVPRAMAAVTSLAGALRLQVNKAVMIQNSNKLALHLLPCDVFARIALVGQEVAALEVELARGLAAIAGPVALLDPRVEPRGYQVDGFAVTFWTYYAPAAPDRDSPAGYADALQRLHAGCGASRSKRRTLRSEPRRLSVWLRTETTPPRWLSATGNFS
jgi:hypothetical protein